MMVKLILEDGQVFEGKRIGAERDVVCEIVFNTAVTGYVELMTDPSYAGQGVVMSSPIIGNYGVAKEDFESEKPWLSAFIVNYITPTEGDYEKRQDLNNFLEEYNIPGMTGADTRKITLTIREKGTMKGMLTGEKNPDIKKCLDKIKEYRIESRVPTVSIPSIKEYATPDKITDLRNKYFIQSENFITKRPSKKFRVALADFGAKHNIKRILLNCGCIVTAYPWDASFEEMLESKPDGIVLSNGPGDPKACGKAIAEIEKIMDFDIPTFGICMGHQLLALAAGFDTYKLKYGHRGINHPVKEVKTGKCHITSQNHSYCVSPESVDPKKAFVSHMNINDSSVEGLEYIEKDIFSVQFHPEGAPGPMDTIFLFEKFLGMMEKRRTGGKDD